MKKIFALLTVATLVWGCSKDDVAQPSSYTLIGYNSLMTRTAFGTPDYDLQSIPFLWSEGDKIWVNGQSSEAIAEGGASATFAVQSEPQNGDAVYYNMMATQASEATIAIVPTVQSVAQSLGENGDFGYATVQDGSFTLSHATSYLWFDIAALPSGYTLKSIRLNAGDAIVAGEAQWTGSAFGAVSGGRSIIDLAVNKSSVSGAEVAMVVLPATIESATITYELSDGDDTKYYEQSLGANTIAAGATARIVVDLAVVTLKDYVLRTLTFEDNHALFTPYSFTAPSPDYYSTSEMETIDVNSWSNLIVDEDKQSYGSSFIYGYSDYYSTFIDTNYNWRDSGNTNLVQKEFKANYGYKDFAGGGGYVISRYADVSAETVNAAEEAVYNGAYNHQLSIPIKAHSGENFAIGFHTAIKDAPENELPVIEFGDGRARTVDHMWVTNTSVALWAMTYGSGFSAAFDSDDYLIIDAIGYNGDTKTKTLSFDLADGTSIVNDWRKWNLSGLGSVTKVLFRMREAQLSGDWYCTPLYVAIDDIAVRFE